MEEICNRLALGESLTSICADTSMPTRRTIRQWRLQDKQIDDAVILVVQDQADFFAETMLAVARAAYGKCSADVQVARLEVDTLKFLAAQQSPKKWGLKQQVEMSGAMDVRAMSDAELQEEMIKVSAELNQILQDVGIGQGQ